jgi:hypothetical protein
MGKLLLWRKRGEAKAKVAPKKKEAKQLTSWSFSRYNDYKLCPLKAKLKYLDKIAEPGNAGMDRGNTIHDQASGFIKGKLKKLSPDLKSFAPLFKKLQKQYKKKINGMVVEDTWAFTADWQPTVWNDWAGCAVRIKLDAAYHEDPDTLVVVDWKSGKFREEMAEDYLEQLELYALGALLTFGHLKAVKPQLAYTDLGLIHPAEELVFTREDVPELKKLWADRTQKMLVDKRFAPRPNDKCRWCHYRKSNKDAGGGQCKY